MLFSLQVNRNSYLMMTEDNCGEVWAQAIQTSNGNVRVPVRSKVYAKRWQSSGILPLNKRYNEMNAGKKY